jgi:hypothetical protein
MLQRRKQQSRGYHHSRCAREAPPEASPKTGQTRLRRFRSAPELPSHFALQNPASGRMQSEAVARLFPAFVRPGAQQFFNWPL